ncbi:hypothetical protein UlMin_038826 [Ulmus minor]
MKNEKISGNYYEIKVSGLKLKAVWDAVSTNTFCELCIKEVEVGHRPGTHFDKVGLENLCKNFNTATRRMYTKPQLKNKWDTLKTDWKIWKDLIGKKLVLDGIQKRKLLMHLMIGGEKYPQASKFRKEGIAPEIEENIDRMFMNTTTTRDYAWTPTSGFTVSLIESSGDSNENNIQETSKDIPRKRSMEQLGKQSTRWMKGKKKVKVGGAAILSEQIDHLVDAVESYKRSETSSACNKTPEFTLTQCIEVLKDIPGLDRPPYFFATGLFCAKEKISVYGHG